MKVIVFFIVLLTVFACNSKDPCANLVCKDYQECVNGACQCVANTFNMGRWCAPKQLGTRDAFYSTSSNCKSCMASDTALVYLSREVDANNGYSFVMAFPKDVQYWRTGIGQSVSYYYEKTDGDSFRIFGVDNLYTCNDGGLKRTFPVIFGKLNPAKDSLKVKIVWHDPSKAALVPIDSCTKLFTR